MLAMGAGGTTNTGSYLLSGTVEQPVANANAATQTMIFLCNDRLLSHNVIGLALQRNLARDYEQGNQHSRAESRLAVLPQGWRFRPNAPHAAYLAHLLPANASGSETLRSYFSS